MSLDEDDVLATALGAQAAVIGARQGPVRAGTRRLKKNVLEIDLALAMPPDAAADRTRQVLRQLGRELDIRDDGETADSQVVGMLGAGFFHLNPAMVTVTIRAADDGSKLVVPGAAKECLIKQRAGEEAAKRVAEALA
jgi:hypothetical protein